MQLPKYIYRLKKDLLKVNFNSKNMILKFVGDNLTVKYFSQICCDLASYILKIFFFNVLNSIIFYF